MLCPYSRVTWWVIVCQTTGNATVCWTTSLNWQQIKHQISALLAFVRGFHRDIWIPLTKVKLCGKCSPPWRHQHAHKSFQTSIAGWCTRDDSLGCWQRPGTEHGAHILAARDSGGYLLHTRCRHWYRYPGSYPWPRDTVLHHVGENHTYHIYL